MKFKVGDKVKILPSAVIGGVSEKAVGKIGRIIEAGRSGYFNVLMLGEDSGPSPHLPWAVYPNQMEQEIVVGQQLLLWDDIWEKEV